MLLPIVLLLTSAASMQIADAVNGKQTADARKEAQSFERDRQFNKQFDAGIFAGHGQRVVCAKITAYVFSSGENPKLKYVTDCPTLRPFQPKRAHRNDGDKDQRTLQVAQ
jgi:hypothetical protein